MKIKTNLAEAINSMYQDLNKIIKSKSIKFKDKNLKFKNEIFYTKNIDENSIEYKLELLNSKSEKNVLVTIIMGSENDRSVMEPAAELLKSFGINYEMKIISAHRLPNRLREYLADIEQRGIEVIIAGAGMAAHLPGVVASQVKIPVIGIPIQSGALNGLDALLSIVQMPSGIPVATMAINGAKNSAIFAIQILSLKYPEIKNKYAKYIEETQHKLEKLTY